MAHNLFYFIQKLIKFANLIVFYIKYIHEYTNYRKQKQAA